MDSKKTKDKARSAEGQKKAAAKPKIKTEVKPKAIDEAVKKAADAMPGDRPGTFVSVSCQGAELFVDGARKGRISSSPLTVEVSPGKHAVIVSHAKGISSQDIVFDAGKMVRLNPDFCNQ